VMVYPRGASSQNDGWYTQRSQAFLIRNCINLPHHCWVNSPWGFSYSFHGKHLPDWCNLGIFSMHRVWYFPICTAATLRAATRRRGGLREVILEDGSSRWTELVVGKDKPATIYVYIRYIYIYVDT
jgi:hypothetical protein